MAKQQIVAHFVGKDPVADDRFWRTARTMPDVQFRAVVPAGPAVPVEQYPNIEITLDTAHDVKLNPGKWGDDPAGWAVALTAQIGGSDDDPAEAQPRRDRRSAAKRGDAGGRQRRGATNPRRDG